MSVTYRTTLKTTRMNAVVTDIGAAGKLVIGTSGMAAVLATLPLNNPVGTVSGAVLTINVTGVSASATGTGTAAAAKITDGTNDIVTGLTVATSGADITINNASVTSGQTVTLTSGSITHG
jgi:hypothetical protein